MAKRVQTPMKKAPKKISQKAARDLLAAAKAARWWLAFGENDSNAGFRQWAEICDQVYVAILQIDPSWECPDEANGP